ncbi:hypothetical protein AVEN_190374-1 [Araneus ventricosus]|uniref:Uncharacterized protein n=1 Tax=Araneus ventricosus TaxID=182803 RepID=A0A4Y2JRM1_ARAVE|nr:hypothetical protein AVEN_190374-1 [Araneus ventricosus]
MDTRTPASVEDVRKKYTKSSLGRDYCASLLRKAPSQFSSYCSDCHSDNTNANPRLCDFFNVYKIYVSCIPTNGNPSAWDPVSVNALCSNRVFR